MNEFVYQGIESSIAARRQYDTSTDYEEILGDAMLVYNSTPHSSTGYSPYYMLFGKDLIFEDLTDEVRRARIKDLQSQAMIRAVIGADEGLRLYRDPKIQVGDGVVYYLQMREREGGKIEDKTSLIKYSPKWSTPVTVMKVNDGNVELDCGMNKRITVPIRLIKRVGKDIPLSLQPLAINEVKRESARRSLRPDWEKKPSLKRVRIEE